MNEPKRMGGCLGAILLILVILAVVLIGKNREENSPTLPTGSGTSAGLTESPDPDLDLGNIGLELPSTEEPTDAQEAFADSLRQLVYQDGFFRTNAASLELVQLDSVLRNFGSCESSWAGRGTVGSTQLLPMTLDRFSGDELVVTGSEWIGLPQEQQDSMTLNFYPAALLGYGNHTMYDNITATNLDSIGDISISAVSGDPDSINTALLGTGFKCLSCKKEGSSAGGRYHFLADRYDTLMRYGIQDGTQPIEDNVSMIHPYFAYREDTPVAAPVQITPDGYYTVDISVLAPGYYVIDGFMGDYALVII